LEQIKNMAYALLLALESAAPAQAAQLGPVRLEVGRLHEALTQAGADGAGRGFLLGAAQGLSPRLLVWVREAGVDGGAPYAPGLSQFGIDLSRLIVIEARRRAEALWAAEEGLKQTGAVVLLELGARGKPLDLLITRRLALAAQTHATTVLALRGDASAMVPPPSAAWTRWRIRTARSRGEHRDEAGAPTLEAELFRHRGGEHRRFLLEWTDGAFRAEALGGDLAAPAVDGQAEAPRRAG
jgi:protein ImuA